MTSVEDAKLLAQYGQHNRHVGTTLLNQASSRSHCIFTVKLIRLMDTDRPRQAIINRYVQAGRRGEPSWRFRDVHSYTGGVFFLFVYMYVCMYMVKSTLLPTYIHTYVVHICSL